MINKKAVCCLAVRDCETFLYKIFENLDLLSSLFTNFCVIFVYDNCKDNSEKLLFQYKKRSKFKVYVVHNYNNNSQHRTIRIANSRNLCLNIMYNEIKSVDFHFMIDADDVNVEKWNIEVIEKYLQDDNWDALSFNRNGKSYYYDLWALLFDDYKHHCWGFGHFSSGNPTQSAAVTNKMRELITNKLNKLNDYELLECWSAFNGIAVYRSEKFRNIKYDGHYKSNKTIISDEEREITVSKFKKELGILDLCIDEKCILCCEHIYFHLSAIKQNNARIRISKQYV
jgi:hypothetical protein